MRGHYVHIDTNLYQPLLGALDKYKLATQCLHIATLRQHDSICFGFHLREFQTAFIREYLFYSQACLEPSLGCILLLLLRHSQASGERGHNLTQNRLGARIHSHLRLCCMGQDVELTSRD